MGKGEIAHEKQFVLFPQFSKDLYCRHTKNRGLFGKGLYVTQYVLENITQLTMGESNTIVSAYTLFRHLTHYQTTKFWTGPN